MANDFLTFAGDPAANVMTQTDYAASGFTTRLLGFTTGTALAVQLNKVWRQSSMIAAMISNFTVTQVGGDMLDNGSTAGMNALQTNFTNAVQQAARAAIGTGYLPLTGGTLTGPLTVAAPTLSLTAGAGADASFIMGSPAGRFRGIFGRTGALSRWVTYQGDNIPETGSNAGSNYSIGRYNDAGTFVDLPLAISRATGIVNFTQTPTINGLPMAFLPLTGGTLTGPLGVSGNGITYTVAAANAHAIGFGWTGTHIRAWVDGTNIGDFLNQADINTLLGAYLPLAGGTVTGNLVVNGTLTAGQAQFNSSIAFMGASDFRIAADGSWRYFFWSSQWYDAWRISDGMRLWAGPGGTLMLLDGAGNLTITGRTIVNSGRLLSAANGPPSIIAWHQGGGTAMGFYVNGGTLAFCNADGNGNPISNLCLMTSAGAFNVPATVNIGQTLTVAGAMSADSGYFVNGVNAATVLSRSWVAAGNDTSFNMSLDGSNKYFYFQQGSGDWGWRWNRSNGDLTWHTASQDLFTLAAAQQLILNSSVAYKYGGGSWWALSDARVKIDEGAYTTGLEAIRQINPKRYRYRDGATPYAATDKQFIGLIAQEAEGPMPEMVSLVTSIIDGKEVDDFRALDAGPLLFALVNAVKELDRQINR